MLFTTLVSGLALALALPAPTAPAPNAACWHEVKRQDGIVVKRAESERPKAPWSMAEGELAAPLTAVIAHLTNFAALRGRVPRLDRLQVLEQHEGEALVYFHFDLPWPVSNREWTVRYRWQLDHGVFRMTWTDENELGPPPSGAVRVSPVRGYWELTATAQGTTFARYVFLAELGGRLPHVVVEQTVWRQPLETFRGIRQVLADTLSAAR